MRFDILKLFGCAGPVLLLGLSLVAAGGAPLWVRCPERPTAGASLVRSMGSGPASSVVLLPDSVVAAPGLEGAGSMVTVHGLHCSTACGIFPDWGIEPVSCTSSQILNPSHQRCPKWGFYDYFSFTLWRED